MTSLEAETHMTVAVLEGMLASYTERIPEVYLPHFIRDMNRRIANAKRPLLFLDNA